MRQHIRPVALYAYCVTIALPAFLYMNNAHAGERVRTNAFSEPPKYEPAGSAPTSAHSQMSAIGAQVVVPNIGGAIGPSIQPADIAKWDTVELLGYTDSKIMLRFQRGAQQTVTVVKEGASFAVFGQSWRLRQTEGRGFDVLLNGDPVTLLDATSAPVQILIPGRGAPGVPGAAGTPGAAPQPYAQPYQPGVR